MAQGQLREEDDIEPDVGPFSFYIEAFKELSTCRSSLSLSPIPFTAIADYCKLYNIEDFEDFKYFIRVLDNKFMKLNDKKGKKDAKTKHS